MDIKVLTESMMQKMRGILQSGQEAIPIIVTVSPSDEVNIIGIGEMNSESAKDRVAAILGKLVAAPSVACAIFLCDSYMGSMSKNEYERRPHNFSVREMPGRTEAIVASISGRDIETQMASWRYARNRRGKPKFAQIEWMQQGGELSGRFVPESETRKVS